jgi:hypothetical protein
MGIAALIGVIATFLPLASVSVSVMGMTQSASGGMPVRDWRGAIDLVCYLAAIGITVAFMIGSRTAFRGLAGGAIAVGAVAVLMAVLLLVATISSASASVSGSVPGLGNLGVSGGSSPAIGTILNLLAAIGVAVGAVLKARQEKLF